MEQHAQRCGFYENNRKIGCIRILRFKILISAILVEQNAVSLNWVQQAAFFVCLDFTGGRNSFGKGTVGYIF